MATLDRKVLIFGQVLDSGARIHMHKLDMQTQLFTRMYHVRGSSLSQCKVRAAFYLKA